MIIIPLMMIIKVESGITLLVLLVVGGTPPVLLVVVAPLVGLFVVVGGVGIPVCSKDGLNPSEKSPGKYPVGGSPRANSG
jgi:hypothetical protein